MNTLTIRILALAALMTVCAAAVAQSAPERSGDGERTAVQADTLAVEPDTVASLSESIAEVDESLDNLCYVMNDLAAECTKRGVLFELACIATPNFQSGLRLSLARLKLNIYRELYSKTLDPAYKAQYDSALAEYRKLADAARVAD